MHCIHVPLLGTAWTIACQAPLSVGFTRQEYCNEMPFPSLMYWIFVGKDERKGAMKSGFYVLPWAICGYAIAWGGGDWSWVGRKVGSVIKDLLHSLVTTIAPEGILIYFFFPSKWMVKRKPQIKPGALWNGKGGEDKRRSWRRRLRMGRPTR